MEGSQSVSTEAVLVIIGVSAVFLFGLIGLLLSCFKKVEQGQALIINKISGEPVVTFMGGMVLPVVHKAEIMDISTKVIRIECHGLRFADDKLKDVTMRFYVRVNHEVDDVIRVARAVGAKRAGDLEVIEELFAARFLEAMRVVARTLASTELDDQLEAFRDQVLTRVGMDLNGYVLDDGVVDFTHTAKVSTAPAHTSP